MREGEVGGPMRAYQVAVAVLLCTYSEVDRVPHCH